MMLLPEEEILLLLVTGYCISGVDLMRKEHCLGVFEREFTGGYSGVGRCLNCGFFT